MVSSGLLRRVALVRTTRATRRNNPGDTILHSHRRENLKSYRANFVPSSRIFVTLMMEALSTSETLVLTRGTCHNIPEGAIRHSPRRENLKFYKIPQYHIYQQFSDCGVFYYMPCENNTTYVFNNSHCGSKRRKRTLFLVSGSENIVISSRCLLQLQLFQCSDHSTFDN
jgi:hypothetical protein